MSGERRLIEFEEVCRFEELLEGCFRCDGGLRPLLELNEVLLSSRVVRFCLRDVNRNELEEQIFVQLVELLE